MLPTSASTKCYELCFFGMRGIPADHPNCRMLHTWNASHSPNVHTGASNAPDEGQLRHFPLEEYPAQAQHTATVVSATRCGIDAVALAAALKDGHPDTAPFQSSDESLAIYRSYSYLQAHQLLEKQEKLRVLEDRLQARDRTDPLRQTRFSLYSGEKLSRQTLLNENTLTSYGGRSVQLSDTRLIT